MSLQDKIKMFVSLVALNWMGILVLTFIVIYHTMMVE